MLKNEANKQLQYELGVIIPPDTRFGVWYLAMHRNLLLKNVMIAVVSSAAYRQAGLKNNDNVRLIVNDEVFWDDTRMLSSSVGQASNYLGSVTAGNQPAAAFTSLPGEY